MNINKYTEKAQEAIIASQQLAEREGHPEVLPEHLLLTLLEGEISLDSEVGVGTTVTFHVPVVVIG